jgi:hypothetical protein
MVMIIRGRRVAFRDAKYRRDATKIQLQAAGACVGETHINDGKWPFWHSGPLRLPTITKGNLALGLAGQLGCIPLGNA